MLANLRPVPALLDKDTVYGGFVEAMIAVSGQPGGVREGSWYDEHVKVHEYAGITAAAREIRAGGCPVLLVAPFTTEIREPDRWRSWVGRLGGEPVNLVWVRTDAATLWARLTGRGSARDTGKLDAFDEFVARMQPEQPPAVPHLEIDNRAGAQPLSAQIAARLNG